MGYTNSCIGENDRIIGGKFNNLRENVYRYFRGKNILIGLIIADFVMMPSVYGYQCYSSIEKELVRILFENYEILSPTFELELPCISFQWKEIEEIISVSRGYTATVIEFSLGRLVKSNHNKPNEYQIKPNWNTAPEGSKWLKITKNGEEVKINNKRSEKIDNKGSRRRKSHNHATDVASKKRIINMNGEVRDSDRSDVTSLEGKINLHINVLARFCIHGAWYNN